MSSENYEANGYGHDVDLLIISHSLHVSYTTRVGRTEKNIQITHIYLISFCASLLWIFPTFWHLWAIRLYVKEGIKMEDSHPNRTE
jgi:hypothetical protein